MKELIGALKKLARKHPYELRDISLAIPYENEKQFEVLERAAKKNLFRVDKVESNISKEKILFAFIISFKVANIKEVVNYFKQENWYV